MNPEIKRLSSIADNMGAKLLPIMRTQNLTKKDVYVVVDTPEKAKKLKKVLEMFKEPVLYYPNHERSSHNGTDYGWGYGFCDGKWQGFNTKWYGNNGKEFKEASIKELKQILAKENLKEGDYVICSGFNNSSIVKIKSISGDRLNVDKELFLDTRNVYTEGFEPISTFKRYATPEEISLLEPKQKELEVGKWYLFTGHQAEHKPLMFITSISGSIVKFRGFNFLGDWVDNDHYTLEDLKSYGYTEATPQEVESALIEEAKRRYKTVDKVKCLVPSYDIGVLEFEDFRYFHDDYNDTLWFRSKNTNFYIKVFDNGKWAEVIKPEEKPKVGDVVKAWDDKSDGYTIGKVVEIGNAGYLLQDDLWWDNAKTITQQEAIELLFGKEASDV